MNVLVDASVWIDHLHRSDPGLVELLQASEVVMHSAVLGELACGTLPNRRAFLSLWSALPPAAEVSPAEALRLIEEKRLWGKGLGWTDVLLIGSTLLSPARLWTRDRSLLRAAKNPGACYGQLSAGFPSSICTTRRLIGSAGPVLTRPQYDNRLLGHPLREALTCRSNLEPVC